MTFKDRKEVFGADLALVWCLKPQLSTAAVAAGVVGTVVAGATPPCSFQDGIAVAEEEEAATAAAVAAPESGCCSAAAI